MIKYFLERVSYLKKKQILILIILLILLFGAFVLYLYRKKNIVNKENIIGSYVYKVKCDKDTIKGENEYSIDTLTLKKDNTFLLEINDCFSFNVLEGDYSFDEKSKTLLLQNNVASFVETLKIKDVNTIIRMDEVDRELIYKKEK